MTITKEKLPTISSKNYAAVVTNSWKALKSCKTGELLPTKVGWLHGG